MLICKANVMYALPWSSLFCIISTKEAHYNLARAYQHLGLNHKAVSLYQRVLTSSSTAVLSFASNSELITQQAPRPFVREAAVNLAAIFQGSGNFQEARSLIRRYCAL
jgi:general transcription factor 3C polypeptide 3 (transcription factor C subunit 4)